MLPGAAPSEGLTGSRYFCWRRYRASFFTAAEDGRDLHLAHRRTQHRSIQSVDRSPRSIHGGGRRKTWPSPDAPGHGPGMGRHRTSHHRRRPVSAGRAACRPHLSFFAPVPGRTGFQREPTPAAAIANPWPAAFPFAFSDVIGKTVTINQRPYHRRRLRRRRTRLLRSFSPCPGRRGGYDVNMVRACSRNKRVPAAGYASHGWLTVVCTPWSHRYFIEVAGTDVRGADASRPDDDSVRWPWRCASFCIIIID